MNINTQQIDAVNVIELAGDIDTKTAPDITQNVLSLVKPESQILIDMSRVEYMSSAGLRMLLSLYRTATAKDAKIALVGLSEDLQDTMSITGFLDFFKTFDSLEAGIKALK
ncbi:STAS domain-containing protein [Capilliphycus salinus ALCB114379]|uniref:STAS domain-containing protein n=1 Tax=Capilliphycus salinus TaxID=2768948 RepID=UPI0039A5BB0E